MKHAHSRNTATPGQRRRKGLAWVAVGASLLLGSTTLALWSAQDEFSGGAITAGDLDIVQTADTTFWDTSPDRNDRYEKVPGTYIGWGLLSGVKAHKIKNLNTWAFVPGDTVAASFSADVTLYGDNMVAKMSLDGIQDSAHGFAMGHSYEIYHKGVKVVNRTELPENADIPLLYLSATGKGQASGLEDADALLPPYSGAKAADRVFAMANTTESFTVVVYNEALTPSGSNRDYAGEAATPTAQDRDGVNAQELLAPMTLKLEQVRDKGNWY